MPNMRKTVTNKEVTLWLFSSKFIIPVNSAKINYLYSGCQEEEGSKIKQKFNVREGLSVDSNG